MRMQHFCGCAGPISFFANGQHKNVGSTRVDDDCWHHVAVVHESSGRISAFVDGRFDGAASFGPVGPNGADLWVGSRAGADAFHPKGEFKHVRCFDKALSQRELSGEASEYAALRAHQRLALAVFMLSPPELLGGAVDILPRVVDALE